MKNLHFTKIDAVTCKERVEDWTCEFATFEDETKAFQYY